jgi:RecG-like helicase
MTKTAPQAPVSRGGIWGRWTKTQAQVEAEELQEQVRGADVEGLTTIDHCTPGQTVTVRGMVRAVTMRPRSTVPALEIELYDGSGSVSVIWLGRRRIPGIDPGRTIVVHGRLTCNADDPTIYNPRYELKPTTE